MRARVNGLQIAYSDEGDGDTLLLVHGFPLNREAWRPQVDAFRASYRVIAPDLRGLGESLAPPGAVPMSLHAEDLHALLQHLEAGPALLVGHSMGGYAALAFARAYPESLRGLGLVGTKAAADTPKAAAARRTLAGEVRSKGPSAVVDAMAPRMLSELNTDPAMAAAVRGLMASATAEGLIGALLGMAERPDATPWLRSIQAPTLVIAGLEDALIPPQESQALAQAIPGAQLKLIPGAGHLVPFEQAEAFNDALREWPERASLFA